MRIALLSVLGCCLLGLPVPASAQASRQPAAIAAATACSEEPLAGIWDTVSLTFDGRPKTDDELLGARVTFTRDRIRIDTVRKARLEFTIRSEPGGPPCALHLTPVSAPGGPAGWMLFALEGDRLRLGFHDDLGHRPTSFESRPDMIVLRLSRRADAL